MNDIKYAKELFKYLKDILYKLSSTTIIKVNYSVRVHR